MAQQLSTKDSPPISAISATSATADISPPQTRDQPPPPRLQPPAPRLQPPAPRLQPPGPALFTAAGAANEAHDTFRAGGTGKGGKRKGGASGPPEEPSAKKRGPAKKGGAGAAKACAPAGASLFPGHEPPSAKSPSAASPRASSFSGFEGATGRGLAAGREAAGRALAEGRALAAAGRGREACARMSVATFESIQVALAADGELGAKVGRTLA